MNQDLFTRYTLGPYTLKNRIVMAPLTRSRSQQPGNIPWRLNAFYYAQRASAGLIVSEATQVSQQGQGYAFTPGIHSREQTEGWRLVTEAVHDAGGLFFMQLWHVGRISHPRLQPNEGLPVAPSAIAPSGLAFVTNAQGKPELLPFVTPRALETSEIEGIIQQFVQGAKNALSAGVDGIEIHAANGYLLDQFLNSSTNRRVDAYGGSVENRARLVLEVVDALSQVLSSQRIGIRLSPLGTFNDMGDENPEALFEYLTRRLNEKDLAYIHVVDPTLGGHVTTEEKDPAGERIMQQIRENYQGTLIVCGGYRLERAQNALKEREADLVAFGRDFISNPDLPERLQQGAPLNPSDPSTYYGGGYKGYVDYPSLREARGEEGVPDYSIFSGT